MVEFRADYLEDKEAVYEDAVLLNLEADRLVEAQSYVDRAKSRALLDLLSYRLDLRVRARRADDQALVENLEGLRQERDRLFRRWAGSGESGDGAWEGVEQARQEARGRILALERQITELWHRILVRNADYASDAALWQVRTEPVQADVPDDCLLVEYFVARGEVLAFVIKRGRIQLRRLGCRYDQLQPLIQHLWLNLRTVRAVPERAVDLMPNANTLLGQLYGYLFAPLADDVAGYERLTIVPHGALHYLPFHALHDGEAYLVAQYEISYLPVASILRYCVRSDRAPSGALALGHSYGGRLPHALDEARAVAQILGGRAYVEEDAVRMRLQETASTGRVIHIATHGEFRPDNPLFSGLALADGWLTTLDIFDLQLKASLVTLSACETGQSVVGGGDELQGLMRAVLYAGAASLIVSMWTAEDRSTARLMKLLYGHLAEGARKGEALRHAQRDLMAMAANDGERAETAYAHPYYWAPFFLVGDAGAL
jgi:CHAT domain-containing protein